MPEGGGGEKELDAENRDILDENDDDEHVDENKHNMIAAAVITSRRTGLSILRWKPTLPFMTLDCFKIKFQEIQCL